MELNEMCNKAYAHVLEKKIPVKTFAEHVVLMYTELSEAFEEYRNGKSITETYFSQNNKPEGIPSELADVVIRIASFCGEYGIDLNSIIEQKMNFNLTRPKKHGGKVC